MSFQVVSCYRVARRNNGNKMSAAYDGFYRKLFKVNFVGSQKACSTSIKYGIMPIPRKMVRCGSRNVADVLRCFVN